MAFSKKALGRRLAQLRAQAGLSQRDCAKALEVTDKAVSKWETGSSFPSMESMVRIAQLYGIELSELFAGAEGGAGRVTLIAVRGATSPEKAAALRRASDELGKRGYRVIMVGSTAEELARSGARRDLCGAQALCMQTVALQVAREEAALGAARAMAGKVAVLCDGSVLDARAQASGADFAVALRAAGISAEQARDRYDALFAWPPASRGASGAAQALASQGASASAGARGTALGSPDRIPDPHPESDGSESADGGGPGDAAYGLAAQVLAFLDEGLPFGEERTLLVRRPATTVLDAQKGVRASSIATDFIVGPNGALHALARLVEGDSATSLLDGSPIDEGSYRAMLALASPETARIEKRRWGFPSGGAYVRVDRYPFMPYTALARVSCRDDAGGSAVPGFLSVVRDVTGSPRFSEETFARELKLGRL